MPRRHKAVIIDGKGYRLFPGAAGLQGGSAYTVADYVLPRTNVGDDNPNKGKLELHVPFANYMGPRTDLKRRLAENIQPTSVSDAAAKRHDIEYHNIGAKLARGEITREQAAKMVRASDQKLVGVAAKKALRSLNPIERLHGAVGATGIIAKTAAEDLGALNPQKFIALEDPSMASEFQRTDQKVPDVEGGKAPKRAPRGPKAYDPVKQLRKRMSKKVLSKK